MILKCSWLPNYDLLKFFGDTRHISQTHQVSQKIVRKNATSSQAHVC